ncbi:MAG: transporter [Clostridiales bacterium]|jgi:MFS family permease|nr:transporter [Clostridiales bacterium]
MNTNGEGGVVTKEKAISYKEVFKQKEYMKLILANIINRFGDSIDAIAFTWLVYDITNSAAWSAIIFGFNKVPTIFLQPFAGALVENMNKKRIMIITDIIRGICVGIVALTLILGVLNPWILLATTIIISSVEAFGNPAGTAVLPKILKKEYYNFGMSLSSTVARVVELAGLAAAGGIIALYGTKTAIFIDAITFGLSALIISFINTKEEKNQYKKINFKEYSETLKGGFIYVKKKKIILNFVLLAMVTNGLLVPINSLQAPLVKDILRQGEYMLSVISLALVIGMGIGSAVYPYIARIIKTRMIVLLSGFTISAYYLLIVLSGNLSNNVLLIYITCAVTSFFTGVGVSLLISVLSIQFMKQVDEEYLARAGAILGAGCVLAMPVVSFLLGIFTKVVSLTAIFYAIGMMGILFFLFVFFKNVELE